MTRQATPDILDNVLSGATPAPPAATKVAIKDIINDGGTQMRAGLNFETVSEYAEAMLAGVTFPPITLYYDGETYWLADGFHRLQAWKSIYQVAGVAGTYDPAEIPAIIHAGARRDAILHAAGANASHGLRRTNDDKRRAVDVLLRDPEWSQWSDRVIAEACAVSHMFVSNLRKKMTVNGLQSPTERKGADGRTINTANIGNRPAAAPPAARGGFLTVAALEATVRQLVPQVYGAEPQMLTPKDMRTGAQMRAGRFWLLCTQSLQGRQFRLGDLAQAINNVADQMAQRANAPADDLHTGAGRTPPPPLTVAEIVEELTPHLAAFAPGNIAGAALGQQNDVTERCALVLSDFTYQQTDLRRALQRISRDRHLAMSKEASAAVTNVDRPLPAWAAEPEAQEPATVEQTVADVVAVHGEPAPVATPARHPQHDDLFEFSELFKLAIGETHKWANLTGEHTAILEAERGLRHLVQRTAAILSGFTEQRP